MNSFNPYKKHFGQGPIIAPINTNEEIMMVTCSVANLSMLNFRSFPRDNH